VRTVGRRGHGRFVVGHQAERHAGREDRPRVVHRLQVQMRLRTVAGVPASSDVVAGRHPIASVLVAEKRLETLRTLLAELDGQVAVYAAGQVVMDAVVGFAIHRGVLAAGTRAEPGLDALLAGLPHRALVVGLCGIANHDNIGGLFRNAAAFGADAVLLDGDCCDPLYRKAIRVSVVAALSMHFTRAGSAG